MTATTPAIELDAERHDLLSTLAKHRAFLRHTLEGLTDEQAGLTPTASALCVGGLVKHVAAVESRWVQFMLDGPAVMEFGGTPEEYEAYADAFRMGPQDTVASVLAGYEAVAEHTASVVASLPDLDASHPLPEAPWFEQGARWSARRVLLHILAETSQHAGHADILRETIDGQKTMG
jgi:hypothetical protein